MIRMMGEIAIAISSSLVLSLIVKATVVSAGALLAVHIAQHSRASIRHLLLATALMLLLVLPVVSVAAPPHEVGVPVPDAGPEARTSSAAAVNATVSSLRFDNDGELLGEAADGTWSWPSQLLTAVWLTGLALCTVPVLAGLVRSRRLCRNGIPWRRGQAFVAELAGTPAAGARIEVLLDEAVSGPMTCGVFSPAIVLPRDARTWDPEDLRRAVVHELEHIRRRDWFTLCIARTVCAIYWFHPLVWMTWRQLRLEAEKACDDAVLRDTVPDAYADQLVALAERVTSGDTESVLAMANRGDLFARISAVLDDRLPRGRAGSRWIATVAASGVLVVVGLAPLRAIAIPQVGDAPIPVASIKANISGSPAPIIMLEPTGLNAANIEPQRLIEFAYGLSPVRVTGGPDWINSARYNVRMKGGESGAALSAATVRLMLRRLLVDRFKLSTHLETRELPVYDLVVHNRDRGLGPNLRPSTGSCAKPPAAGAADPAVFCGLMFRRGGMDAGGIAISDLADELWLAVDRPVRDRTGLTGTFDLTLNYTDTASLPPDSELSVFTAVREQLGLRLNGGRGPVEVLVIDGIEKPTED